MVFLSLKSSEFKSSFQFFPHRFHFEGLQSVKVTSPVDFPLGNFCLDFVCSAETSAKENYVYDLTGCVCHTGSKLSKIYGVSQNNCAPFLWLLQRKCGFSYHCFTQLHR